MSIKGDASARLNQKSKLISKEDKIEDEHS